MLRSAQPTLNSFARFFASATTELSSKNLPHTSTQPVLRKQGAKRRELTELLNGVREHGPVKTLANQDDVMDISGVPEDHQWNRRARVYKPTRNAEQSGWNNTNLWKIELDQQERWENPCIGYSSTADPLSNISMQLDFASEQEAVDFCRKNKWPYVVEKEQVRQIKPKDYGANFHWSKRARVSTK